MKSRILVEKIVYAALFTSIAVVIKIFINYETTFFRLSFFEFPLMLAGILLGPLYGALAGFVTDLNYIITNPRGMIVSINWFTLEAIAWGFLPGLFFQYFKYSKRKLYVMLIFTMPVAFIFNTLGIRLYSTTETALVFLPYRLLRDIAKYFIYIYLVHLFLTDRRFNQFVFFKRFYKKHQLNSEQII